MLNINPPIAFKIFVVMLVNKDQNVAGKLFEQLFQWIEKKYMTQEPHIKRTMTEFKNKLFSL